MIDTSSPTPASNYYGSNSTSLHNDKDSSTSPSAALQMVSIDGHSISKKNINEISSPIQEIHGQKVTVGTPAEELDTIHDSSPSHHRLDCSSVIVSPDWDNQLSVLPHLVKADAKHVDPTNSRHKLL